MFEISKEARGLKMNIYEKSAQIYFFIKANLIVCQVSKIAESPVEIPRE